MQKYEIEMKVLLTKEQYENLQKELPKKFKQIKKETTHTHIFLHNLNDIRLRHTDKKWELVHKIGESTDTTRPETITSLNSKDEFNNLLNLFKILKLEQYPSWKKHETIFIQQHNNYKYTISLQEIKDFAHILEVEFMSNKDDSNIHIPNIKQIIKNLGLEPIDKEKFNQKINNYIDKYHKNKSEKHNFYKK